MNPDDAAEQVFAALDRARAAYGWRDLLVAYSGGLDSSVLLALAVDYAAARGVRTRAVHVDHGLHPSSHSWARHCVTQAAARGIECEVVTLEVVPPAGDSVEAWAREARYQAFAARLDHEGCLLTAHHRDDQVETVLLRVLSGAGPHGLAGMPAQRRLGAGYLLRPLLGLRRGDIRRLARERKLEWLEDPGNVDSRFLRNRVRNAVLPALEDDFPGLRGALERLADIQSALGALLDRLADGAIDARRDAPDRLALDALSSGDPALAPYVLRRWLHRAGVPLPGHRQLRALQEEVVGARLDGAPLVAWRGFEVRRYRSRLYVMPALAPPPAPGCSWAWQRPLEAPLHVPGGTLSLVPSGGAGLDPGRLRAAPVSVRFRAGGERCVPEGRTHSQTLKRLFQEWGVPPWERPRMPLIEVDGAIAAVGPLCVCRGYGATPGVRVQWTPIAPAHAAAGGTERG